MSLITAILSFISSICILLAVNSKFAIPSKTFSISISSKNDFIENERKKSLVNQLIRDPKSILEFSEEQANELVSELSELLTEKNAYKAGQKATEEQHRYDVRILNILATLGLKAASIAHELKNDRNNIGSNYESIVEALKEYDIWDELNSPNRTRLIHKNVPRLLEQNREINQKILVFMGAMLASTEKRKFNSEDLNIYSMLAEIKQNWERDFAWVKVNYDAESDLTYRIPADIITVIFDNLLLNSIQQNESSQQLDVTVSASLVSDSLCFEYRDSGRGLASKYLNAPERIFEVHETSRQDGHGLGMWILKNTVDMTGGQVVSVGGVDGFSIEFELGGRL